MKHAVKITMILILMFFVTQLIGLVVANVYAAAGDESIPFGMAPPDNISPAESLSSIVFAIFIAVILILLLMKLKIVTFLRLWFFVIITLALGITINAIFISSEVLSSNVNILFFTASLSSAISLLIALPLSFLKVFRRNIIIHNFTELLIYPGIAVIIIPLLTIWTAVALLVIISLYDMYAVWHAGFMQKMAKYQMKEVGVFSGFLVPYVGKKEAEMIRNLKESKTSGAKSKLKKIKISLAILGGGDVIFPIILAGIVMRTSGIIPALGVSIGATIALAGLFYISKKGKFYPAMPFISAGCFAALAVLYALNLL